MAKANFPASPTNNQTVIIGGLTYVYNSSKGIWKDQISNIGSTSDNAPANPVDGQLWYNSLTGALFVYYDDGTSSQWVGVSGPAGTAGTDGDAGAAGAAGSTTTYANLAAFPSSGNTAGDMGVATDTKSSYMWDGVAWQRLAMGSQIGPRFSTSPSSTYALNADGTTSTITAVAVDESGFPVTYDWDGFSGSTVYNASSLPPQVTAVTDSDGVFTLTPSTVEANAGNFSFRVKASDGVLATPAISAISLQFKTIITIAARQTRGPTNYVEPTSTGVTTVYAANGASGSGYNYFPEGATVAASGMTTGKRYVEAKWTSTITGSPNFVLGICERTTAYNNATAGGYGGNKNITLYNANGKHYGVGGMDVTSGLSPFTLNDTFQIAYDTDAGKIWMGRNDVWSSNGGDPSAGGAGISLSHAQNGYAFTIGSGTGATWSAAFTWGGTNYTKPTGFSHF